MNSITRRVLLACVLIGVFAIGIAVGQNKFGKPTSVIHVVTLKWKADSTAAQRQAAIDGVAGMAGKIKGIKNVYLKTLRVQSPSQDKPYDAAFAIEFENEAAAKAYATDPAHAEWEKGYQAIREESRSHQVSN